MKKYVISAILTLFATIIDAQESQKYCLTFLVAVHNWVLLKNKTMEDKNNKIIIVIKNFKSYKLK